MCDLCAGVITPTLGGASCNEVMSLSLLQDINLNRAVVVAIVAATGHSQPLKDLLIL
jgi:hypothetical protein